MNNYERELSDKRKKRKMKWDLEEIINSHLRELKKPKSQGVAIHHCWWFPEDENNEKKLQNNQKSEQKNAEWSLVKKYKVIMKNESDSLT